MKEKLDISRDFWKDFKNHWDFIQFFSELSKRALTRCKKPG